MQPLPRPSTRHLKSTPETLGEAARYVVGIVVFHHGQDVGPPEMLVVQRAPTETRLANMREIPGGRIEPGESMRDAVVRELMEEVGLQVDEVLGDRRF